MNIIFIAPPAAGKGTQSKFVSNEYSLEHISTGDLLREVATKEDEFSKSVQEKMSKGMLISDDIILNLIKEKIKDKNGFIFDGFPRTLVQAEAFDDLLSELNQKIDYVIYLKIAEDIARERIVGRMVCPSCGNVYNYGLDAEKEKHICKNCNETLIKRQDDTLETFNNRFKIYMEQTSPIIDYYKNQGILFEVDSSVSPLEVFEQIKRVINKND